VSEGAGSSVMVIDLETGWTFSGCGHAHGFGSGSGQLDGEQECGVYRGSQLEGIDDGPEQINLEEI